MRALNPIEIQQVGGGATHLVHFSPDAYLGALVMPWAAVPALPMVQVPFVPVALNFPAMPRGLDGSAAGS